MQAKYHTKIATSYVMNFMFVIYVIVLIHDIMYIQILLKLHLEYLFIYLTFYLVWDNKRVKNNLFLASSKKF